MKKLMLLVFLFIGCCENPVQPVEQEKYIPKTMEDIMVKNGWSKNVAKIVYTWSVKNNYTEIVVIDSQTICGQFKNYKWSEIEQAYWELQDKLDEYCYGQYLINLITANNIIWELTIYNVASL